jgi:hypothetical protein
MREALVELRASDLDAHLAELAHHFFQAALPGQAAPPWGTVPARPTEPMSFSPTTRPSVATRGHCKLWISKSRPSMPAAQSCSSPWAGRRPQQPIPRPHAQPPFLRASEATVSARFEQAEQLAQEGLMLGQQAQHQGVLAAFLVTMATIRFAQGRLGELASVFEEAIERPPALPAWRATLAVALCQADRIDDARGQFERLAVDDFAGLPRDFTWMSGLAALAWTCASLNDRQRAPILYDLLAPFGPYNVRISRLGVGCLGPVTHYLGLLAATMSRWEDAIRHFQGSHRAQQLPRCTGLPRKQSPPVGSSAAQSWPARRRQGGREPLHASAFQRGQSWDSTPSG